MQPFSRLEAVACPLGLANIDTDQLIPARFMSRSRSDGYGGCLLHDLRFAADSSSRHLVLDDPRYRGAAILVARRNFGTGSSREAAVYALADFGIRCVIAPSFGDIFAANAVKNGMLPATVTEGIAERLLSYLVASPPRLVVDLETQQVSAGNDSFTFTIDAVRRLQLLNGWDDLELTLRHQADIDAYRLRRKATAPWAWPEDGTAT